MDRRGTETPSERPYFQQPGGQYYEEPQQYDAYEEEHEVLQPEPVAAKPKKKNKIKQIFSRLKRKKTVEPKRKPVVLDTPDDPPGRPLPHTPRTESDLQPPAPVFHPPPSEISSRRYELRDPGFAPPPSSLPRRMSVTTSRDESLRARENATRTGTREGSVFDPPRGGTVVPPSEPSLFGPAPTGPTTAATNTTLYHEQHWDEHHDSVYDAGPPPMLVDERSGNRVPRDYSYASTGSHPSGVPPKKKKRSLGGMFKRIFSRKKKKQPPAVHPVTIVESDPADHQPHYVEQEVYVEPAPPTARTSRTSGTGSAHRPAVVVRPGSSRTHSARTSAASHPAMIPVKAPSSRTSSAVPPVVSPRSSRSRPSTQEPILETMVPISPRDSMTLRRGTGSSVVPPRRYNTGSSVPVPKRYNTGTSFNGLGRHGTNSSTRLGRQATASTGRTVPIATAPIVSQVTSSTNSPSPSIRTADKSWGEVHVPPQPAPAPPPVASRPGGLGLGLGSRPLAGAIPITSRPAARPTARAPRRTYAAPPPRKPYVHVPRPIPPPPRYPSLPTRILPATTGSDAQVQMIVTALRDLAAEERHRTAVTEQRLAEERAWNEEERQRDAELRALIAQLVTRNGSRATVDEFGVREGLRTETITPTAAARGLGVGGAGEDDALLALLLAASRL
ncbi:unnamed protein product [Rhizoctonia solani]|uniref:Uncharacterized protein n=1 Tax=Rhizoctonia solani TaxID=456999 RepID=A0A8H3CUZ2_9AGAM|nr:unnamed protein product [Rhizoctonia solani]